MSYPTSEKKVVLLWMSNNTPYALTIQVLAVFLLIISKLHISQDLHCKSGTEKSYSKSMGVFGMNVEWRSQGASTNSFEGKRERKGDDRLEKSFR